MSLSVSMLGVVVDTSMMIGRCLCTQCKSSEKKIDLDLKNKRVAVLNLIFAFCLKILLPKIFFSCTTTTTKIHPVCQGRLPLIFFPICIKKRLIRSLFPLLQLSTPRSSKDEDRGERTREYEEQERRGKMFLIEAKRGCEDAEGNGTMPSVQFGFSPSVCFKSPFLLKVAFINYYFNWAKILLSWEPVARETPTYF